VPEPRADLIVRGRLLLDGRSADGALVIEGGRIARIVEGPDAERERAPTELAGAFVAPGFVDLQINGGFGVEVGDAADAIALLARELPRTGVTAFLPTLITSPPDLYPRAVAAFGAARGSPGAQPIGLHLEGPFLSSRAAGAHDRELIERADWALLDRLLEANALSMMTLAPERPGALDAIARLTERGIVASLGHTAASYEEVIRAIDAGARMVTHLYNAMSPLHHRAPGAVGAALTDDRVVVGIVADGVHAHPAAMRLALRAKGARGVALVTDAMSAAGMGPGIYELAGKRVVVDATSARLDDGTLAGSILTMDEAVRRTVRLGGASPEEALRMASEVPARVLGLDRKGRLAVGCDADLVLLDEELRVRATLVGGRVVHGG